MTRLALTSLRALCLGVIVALAGHAIGVHGLALYAICGAVVLVVNLTDAIRSLDRRQDIRRSKVTVAGLRGDMLVQIARGRKHRGGAA